MTDRRTRLKWAIRFWGPLWVRDFWLLAITVVTVWALVANHNTTTAIQHERAKATLDSCRDQNARHDSTIRQLHQLGGPPGAARFAVSLIDTLAPKQNCAALVNQRVGTR